MLRQSPAPAAPHTPGPAAHSSMSAQLLLSAARRKPGWQPHSWPPPACSSSHHSSRRAEQNMRVKVTKLPGGNPMILTPHGFAQC